VPAEMFAHHPEPSYVLVARGLRAIVIADRLRPEATTTIPIDHFVIDLVRSKRGVERLKQSGITEWFKQALDRTLFEHSQAGGLICLSSNKDDRNLLPAKLQFPLEIGSAHAWHGDVEDQTSGLVEVIRREKLFRR
jgi:hypothetical protein